MKRATIPVVVTVNDDGTVSVKLEGGQTIPLPKDAPVPRRLAQELAAAVAKLAEPPSTSG